MGRTIIETRRFTQDLDNLRSHNKISNTDFENLKSEILENPEIGPIISGTGGLRKIRMKSCARGKSGGFRILYLDMPEFEELYLIWIYGKNEQENVTPEQKKIFKELIKFITLEAK